MWYFAWILGLGLAVGLAVLNGIWHEFHSEPADDRTVETAIPDAAGTI